MVLDHYFMVLPVYRISEEIYYSELNSHIEKQVKIADFVQDEDSDIRRSFDQHLRSTYGGAWEFNEIIGFIKLYFFGSQIRGEYWATKAKRMTKTRKKEYEYKTHKLYMELSIRGKTNESILATVKEYILGCKRELNRRCHIDLREFESLAPHINWVNLYESNNRFL